MPLNDTQKEIIDSVIQYYFDDLSTESKKLNEQIKSIRSAFENSIDEKDEKNELYQLQKCIFSPEINLRRLEDSNPDITFKDVQEYILDYATVKIKNAAQAAQLELDWPKELFQAVFSSLDKYNKPFKSNLLPLESKEAPFEIQKHPGRIYEIVPEYTGAPIPDFILKIYINATTNIKVKIPMPPNNFVAHTPADEIRLRELVKRMAEAVGEDLACSLTMDTLVNLNIIDEMSITFVESEYKSINRVQILMVHKYYLDLLLKDKEKAFTQIWDVSPNETRTLINAGVIFALEQGLFDIEKARKLKPSQVALLSHPFYSKLIFNKELPYKLPEEVCKNLLSPATANLLMKDKINLADAIKMTPSTCAVMANEFYFDMLMKDKLDFNLIKALNLGQERLLLTPLIIQQISQGIIQVTDILNMSPAKLRIIAENPLITEIINAKLLTLANLNRIPYHPINRFFNKYNSNTAEEDREFLLDKLNQTKDKEKIKILLRDFLVLSDQNILNSEDLCYILRYIESELIMCFNRDQYDTYRSHLLLSLSIKEKCEKNLQTRLQALLEDIPHILLNNSKDSIRQIHHACEFIDANPQPIAERALYNAIVNSYKGVTHIPVDKLITYSQMWKLKPEKTWAQTFCIRFLRLLSGKNNMINHKIDSEELFSHDLKTTPISQQLSMPEFQYCLLDKLHHDMKFYMAENYNLDDKETPMIYKQVYKQITQTDDELDSLTDVSLRKEKLIHSFKTIAQYAGIELNKIENKPMSLTTSFTCNALEEKQSDKVIASQSLFKQNKLKEHQGKIIKFCRYLYDLPEILNISEKRISLECKC